MAHRASTEEPLTDDSPVGGKSAGQLMKEVSESVSVLFRKEIELAKQELGESVSVKARGAVIIGAAGVLAFFALIFVLLALRDGLDSFLWRWVADLITAAVLLVIAGIAALVARRKLATPIKADMTKQTIKDDVEMARSLGKRAGPTSPVSSADTGSF